MIEFFVYATSGIDIDREQGIGKPSSNSRLVCCAIEKGMNLSLLPRAKQQNRLSSLAWVGKQSRRMRILNSKQA